jgi:TolB-like protein/DNA-binding winged helix-turn-helix (wHTH) protein/Tfp pilus assembly protein PilF
VETQIRPGGRNEPARNVRFGRFELDLQRRELRKEGRRLRLQEQPFQILQTLLESPGEVVSREEIRKRLWPDGSMVEFDHSINAAVKRLRDVLRDSADKPRYIETVARRGYRFIAELGTPGPTQGDAVNLQDQAPHIALSPLPKNDDAPALTEHQARPPGETGEPPRPFRSHKAVLAGALVLSLVILTAAVLVLRHGSSTQSGAGSGRETITSVAVLPFVNAGGSADTEYLADGITDSLINDLSEVSGLKVMSRGSVFRYKGQNTDAKKIAEALGVRDLLTGRVTQRGGDLSVSVELVDGRDNSHIWGEKYQRKFAAILNLEQDIARDITEKLRLRLSKEASDRLARQRTNSPEAYQLYLKGRFYWFKWAYPRWRPGAATDFSKSRDYFRQAIEVDPAYALAYTWLGHYYAMAAALDLMSPEEGWPKAETAFHKALELDPSLPESRAGLGVTQWMGHRDWASAERELQLALQMRSGRPDALRGDALYARFLAAEGRFDEAIAQARGAIESDPLSIRYSSALAVVYYYARRYEESIRQYRQALELNPNDVWIHENLADAYERQGLQRETVGEWRATLMVDGDTNTAAILDRAYASGGFRAAAHALARKKLEQFERWTDRGVLVPAAEYARAYLRLGQKEQAIEWLSKACDEHTIFVLFIKTDPLYDGLRADPRFQELLKRIQRA